MLLRQFGMPAQALETGIALLPGDAPANAFAHGANAKAGQQGVVGVKLLPVVVCLVHGQGQARTVQMVSTFVTHHPEGMKQAVRG